MKTPLPASCKVRYAWPALATPLISIDDEPVIEVPIEPQGKSASLAFQILAHFLPWRQAWNNHATFVVECLYPALQQAYPHYAEDFDMADPISMDKFKGTQDIVFRIDFTRIFPHNVLEITETPDDGNWKRILHKVGVESLITLYDRKRYVQGRKYRLMIARGNNGGSIDNASGYNHAIEAWLTPDDMYAIWRGLNRIYGS